MITMVTTIDVRGKTPEAIYGWIVTLTNEKYRQWHPAHREWRTVKGRPDETGSVVFFDEQFEGFRVRYCGEVVTAVPERLLRFRLKRLVALPVHLALRFEPTRAGTVVTHAVTAGYDSAFGRMLDWSLRKTVLTLAFEKALDRHAREEFRNLERVI